VGPALLAVYVGTGAQLLGMGSVTLLFACLGFLSPARRGALMTAMLTLYALMGMLGGYVTAVLAKMFHEVSWGVIFATGILFPGVCFSVFFCLNIMLIAKEAANAVSFATLIGLVAMWFFVSLPLVFMGAKVGYTSDAIPPAKPIHDIPRQIPDQQWYMHPVVLTLAAGAVSFGSVFIEMYFVLSSLWLNKIYYVFGFFALILLILCIACAEVALVLVYFHLCSEEYRWWWRSFWYAGGCGPIMFLYSIYYLTSTLNMANAASVGIYFTYMALLSYALFLVMGTVGFLATFTFVRYIYSSLKVD
jgi:transmembrane 9 superfamily protein 2/4